MSVRKFIFDDLGISRIWMICILALPLSGLQKQPTVGWVIKLICAQILALARPPWHLVGIHPVCQFTMANGDTEAFTLLSLGLFFIIIRIYVRWSQVGGPLNFAVDDYMPLAGVCSLTPTFRPFCSDQCRPSLLAKLSQRILSAANSTVSQTAT